MVKLVGKPEEGVGDTLASRQEAAASRPVQKSEASMRASGLEVQAEGAPQDSYPALGLCRGCGVGAH